MALRAANAMALARRLPGVRAWRAPLLIAAVSTSVGVHAHAAHMAPSEKLANGIVAPVVKAQAPAAGEIGIRSVVLYQYNSCPFCNKARAYFDVAGIPYTVVEVNPLLKGEISWSKDYRKVPIAVINGTRVVDSTVIIDYCEELLRRQQQQQGRSPPATQAPQMLVALSGLTPVGDGSTEESKWRGWVDGSLVRLLAPNIYATLPQAWQAFGYLTERNFSPLAAFPAQVVGSAAMWALAGRLKKKYGIEGDARLALYTALDEWADAVGDARPFMGGATPNLADAAVWGVMRGVAGLDTERDLLLHSRVGPWHGRMAARMKQCSALEHRVGEAPPSLHPAPLS